MNAAFLALREGGKVGLVQFYARKFARGSRVLAITNDAVIAKRGGDLVVFRAQTCALGHEFEIAVNGESRAVLSASGETDAAALLVAFVQAI